MNTPLTMHELLVRLEPESGKKVFLKMVSFSHEVPNLRSSCRRLYSYSADLASPVVQDFSFPRQHSRETWKGGSGLCESARRQQCEHLPNKNT